MLSGIGFDQREKLPSVSVHARRFWVGENKSCVIVAVEALGCLRRTTVEASDPIKTE